MARGPSYKEQRRKRIDCMGTKALDILSMIIKGAKEKLDTQQELTKTELEAVKFVLRANPGAMKSRGFGDNDEEQPEEDLSKLPTEELLKRAQG